MNKVVFFCLFLQLLNQCFGPLHMRTNLDLSNNAKPLLEIFSTSLLSQMLRFVHVTVISGHIASSAAGVWYLPKVYSS